MTTHTPKEGWTDSFALTDQLMISDKLCLCKTSESSKYSTHKDGSLHYLSYTPIIEDKGITSHIRLSSKIRALPLIYAYHRR